jgi:Aromatic-ring-opening dioxygenase LigAB, LigA subunit
MSYALQKLIREINRNPHVRKQFFEAPEEAVAQYPLSEDEKSALIGRDYGRLYRLGVHGLLLRPFSILHSVSEFDYLNAIRKGS